MSKGDWWRPRCVNCGHFVRYDADYDIGYGSGWDTEPPDPTYLCPKCIEKEKAHYRAQGRMPHAWQPANWHMELAKELGFVWVHTEGNSWGGWVKKAEMQKLSEVVNGHAE